MINLNGAESEVSGKATAAGLERFKSEVEGEFNGNKFRVATVVDGDKGWRKFGDNAMPLDGDALANERRSIYLQVGGTTVLPLKGKGFKAELSGEEKVADKPASVVKFTGPDGKDFKIAFDKETGLPVRLSATVAGFMGEDYLQETYYKDYKEFGGIKRATRTEVRRDGEKFLDQELSDYETLDKVEPGTFDEPE